MEKLSLQLNVQPHAFPLLNKNTLTSTRGGKKATLCSQRRQLPDVGKLCSQRLFLSVYLRSLSSPSPLRMAQEKEVWGGDCTAPPRPCLNKNPEKEGGRKSLSAGGPYQTPKAKRIYRF